MECASAHLDGSQIDGVQSMPSFDDVERIFAAHPELCSFYGSRPEALLLMAEEALGVKFPSSYRRFVSKCGAGNFGSVEIYGVTSNRFERGCAPNGVWLTLHLRRTVGLSEFEIVIGDDGMGGQYCLDCSHASSLGESPVVLHGPGDPGRGMQVAPDFPSYVLGRIKPMLQWATRRES